MNFPICKCYLPLLYMSVGKCNGPALDSFIFLASNENMMYSEGILMLTKLEWCKLTQPVY